MACLVTLTHLETTFYMLDLGEARRDRSTDVSSLAVNSYLGLDKLCFFNFVVTAFQKTAATQGYVFNKTVL